MNKKGTASKDEKQTIPTKPDTGHKKKSEKSALKQYDFSKFY
jgi:hypothetical protein